MQMHVTDLYVPYKMTCIRVHSRLFLEGLREGIGEPLRGLKNLCVEVTMYSNLAIKIPVSVADWAGCHPRG